VRYLISVPAKPSRSFCAIRRHRLAAEIEREGEAGAIAER
jgi:hypothetical protein